MKEGGTRSGAKKEFAKQLHVVASYVLSEDRVHLRCWKWVGLPLPYFWFASLSKDMEGTRMHFDFPRTNTQVDDNPSNLSLLYLTTARIVSVPFSSWQGLASDSMRKAIINVRYITDVLFFVIIRWGATSGITRAPCYFSC